MEPSATYQSIAAAVEKPVPEIQDFDAVVRVYWPRIFRFTLASVRDRDAAETLTQECFLKAYRGQAMAPIKMSPGQQGRWWSNPQTAEMLGVTGDLVKKMASPQADRPERVPGQGRGDPRSIGRSGSTGRCEGVAADRSRSSGSGRIGKGQCEDAVGHPAGSNARTVEEAAIGSPEAADSKIADQGQIDRVICQKARR